MCLTLDVIAANRHRGESQMSRSELIYYVLIILNLIWTKYYVLAQNVAFVYIKTYPHLRVDKNDGMSSKKTV